jgi:predicted ATP-grasp superfamily ATP-dependent carboligase
MLGPGRGATVPPGTPGGIVIGGDYQGLGIARSLGRRGVPVCVIDDERSIARYSRYTNLSVAAPPLRDEQQVVDVLLGTARKHGLEGWVVFPTREETVVALARNRDILAQTLRIPTPPWEVTRWAWDKRNTYELAGRVGIPTPRTAYPTSVEEVEALQLQPPVVIKPAIKEHFFYATKAKAWRADTAEELRTLFLKAAALVGPGEVMLQELIPGDGRDQFAYCAFFKDGAAVATMVAQRRRQHPPEFGRASTYVETVEVPGIEELSERFLREIDYYGLIELEYKRDPRSGVLKLLDVNARTWGYHTLGPAAGVDFPALLFDDQIGQPAPQQRAHPGVSWVRHATDLPTAALEIRRGHLPLREYLRSVTRTSVEAVFMRDDLAPALAEVALIPYLAVRRGF